MTGCCPNKRCGQVPVDRVVPGQVWWRPAPRGQIELIRPDQIDEAFLRVEGKDVRYRFVIDLASGRAG